MLRALGATQSRDVGPPRTSSEPITLQPAPFLSYSPTRRSSRKAQATSFKVRACVRGSKLPANLSERDPAVLPSRKANLTAVVFGVLKSEGSQPSTPARVGALSRSLRLSVSAAQVAAP
jgi:hypothetical protein